MERRDRIVGFDEIQKLLPHRYPMLMVDRVLDWTDFQSLRAIKNVTGNDPILAAHFPEMGILPGALLIEGLAQCGLLLLRLSKNPWMDGRLPVLGSVRAKFLKPVVPGDQLAFTVKVLKALSTSAMLRGEAAVNGCPVAECDFTVSAAPPQMLAPVSQNQFNGDAPVTPRQCS